MRTAPVLLRDAVALGLADPAEVLAGRTVLVPQWRSNRVHRLEGAGSVLAFVKQPGPASVLDGDDTVAVERAAWEALQGGVRLPRVLGGPGAGGAAGQGETSSAVVRGDADGSTVGAVTASRGDVVTGTPAAAAGAGVRGDSAVRVLGREVTGAVLRGGAGLARNGSEVVGAVVQGDLDVHHRREPAAATDLRGESVVGAEAPRDLASVGVASQDVVSQDVTSVEVVPVHVATVDVASVEVVPVHEASVEVVPVHEASVDVATGVRGEPVAEDAPPGRTGTVVRGDAVARGVPGGEVGAVRRGDSAAHHTPGGDAVWTAPLPGVQLDRLLGEPVRLGAASTALGRELARLHAVTAAPGTVPARLPWPLHPDRPLPSMAGAPEGSPAADVLAAVREPALAAALAGAARAWRCRVWVHGDLTAANVLLDGDRVGLLDWEAGGAGDPDWDVVCAAAVLHELGGVPSVQRFLAAYAEAGGPGRVAAPLACVHSVVTAWQLAVQVEHLEPSDGSGEPLVDPDQRSREQLDREVATRLGRARRLAGLSGVRS